MTTVKQLQSSEEIKAAIVLLEAERDKLLDRQAQYAEKKRVLAFDAHAGDAKASKRLDDVQHGEVELQARLDSVDAARVEGQRRLVVARAQEQRERNAAKAAELRKVLARFTTAGRQVADALTTLGRCSVELRACISELHGGGIHHPRLEVIDVYSYRALLTALAGTIWAKRFEPLSSVERKNFGDLVSTWTTQMECAIATLGGEQTDKAA